MLTSRGSSRFSSSRLSTVTPFGLVFPIQCDIPHRSEISSVDCDPDLYWTTWHPDLIVQENQRPMPMLENTIDRLQHTPTQRDVIEYFSDSVIFIDDHLAYADLKGSLIFSLKLLGTGTDFILLLFNLASR